jgi:hypothetical protein
VLSAGDVVPPSFRPGALMQEAPEAVLAVLRAALG